MKWKKKKKENRKTGKQENGIFSSTNKFSMAEYKLCALLSLGIAFSTAQQRLLFGVLLSFVLPKSDGRQCRWKLWKFFKLFRNQTNERKNPCIYAFFLFSFMAMCIAFFVLFFFPHFRVACCSNETFYWKSHEFLCGFAHSQNQMMERYRISISGKAIKFSISMDMTATELKYTAVKMLAKLTPMRL